MKRIYLDAAASYPHLNSVGTLEWLGNPHSLHHSGVNGKKTILRAEDYIREKLCVQGGKFYWTGSGSEANRLAIESFCKPGGLVTSVLEHKSIKQLTRKYGGAADATPEGCVDFNHLTRLCNKFTELVSIQLANNETGIINIDPQIARDISAPQALFHSDISQVFCKAPLEGYSFDLVTFSAHKIGGPKGLGCLWVRQGLEGTIPYLGTPSPEAIMSFGSAIRGFPTIKDYKEHMAHLEEVLLINLDERLEFNGKGPHKVPGLLNLAFKDPYIDATELMMQLDTKGVEISLGSACNNKLGERSHVLKAMGLSDERIDSSIRIGLHHHLTVEEVEQAAVIINETIKEMSSGS